MFGGCTRFSQFQNGLGIATNILAKRLDGFVEAGLMERRQVGDSGEQGEYVLTQKGLALKPVVIALTEWGDRWLRSGPIVYESASNGQRVEVQLRRVNDGAKVGLVDVVARPRRARRVTRHGS